MSADEEATALASIPTAAPTATRIRITEQGLTPEGYHYLGSPDAPVTLQDFSDFF